MVDVKEYLTNAATMLCIFCTGYVLIILPLISFTPEVTENQLRLIMSSSPMILLIYCAITFLVLGITILGEQIDIWNEIKKDWEKKRTPMTRMREDEPATYGFERNMTQLNHQTTQESENK